MRSIAPARIGGAARHGRPLAVGEPAHLTVVDPDATWTVHGAAFASLARNTPFEGRTLAGRVTTTVFAGRLTVLDSRLVAAAVPA